MRRISAVSTPTEFLAAGGRSTGPAARTTINLLKTEGPAEDQPERDDTVTIRLDQITSPELLMEAERRFVDRRARRDLAGHGDDRTAGAARLDVAAFLAGQASDPSGAPIPIGLLRLRRQYLQGRSLAFSTVARAASTETDVARTIGGFRLELVEDGDAFFVVVSANAAGELPRHLTLIHEEKRLSLDIPLGNPIGGVLQIGLDPKSADDLGTIDLLKDPKTEIYLS